MATSLLAVMSRLQEAVTEVKAENQRLQERNRILEEENANLRRDAREAFEQRDKAMLDAEFLAVSHKLADSPDTLVAARRRISSLIRKIDRCIEMMKE